MTTPDRRQGSRNEDRTRLLVDMREACIQYSSTCDADALYERMRRETGR